MSAQQLFDAIFNVGLVTMLLTLITSLGMTFSVKQILQPLKRGWLLIGTVIVNSLLAPLVAIGVGYLFPLTSEARVGLAIVTIAAAGPAGLKACQLAKRADMAMAVSFTIVLQVVNIVVAPLWAVAIVKGAKVGPWSIVVDLLFLVLLPLIVGLILRARYAEHRDAWKAGLEKISNIALYIALLAGLAANWQAVVTILGTWVILASTVIVIVYIVLGWVIAFRNPTAAVTISMVSAMRFTPIGLVVISTVLHSQGDYLTPALMFALIDTIIPFAAGAEIGRHHARSTARASHEPKAARTASPPDKGDQSRA